jgi:hypothetical protein
MMQLTTTVDWAEAFRKKEPRDKTASEQLADKGIAFEVIAETHGNNFNILKRPDGMPDEEVYPLLYDALADWYGGPGKLG